MAESVVIIPTYNEIENIERMLETVLTLDPPFHVLIVDDGSPTAQLRASKPSKQSTRNASTCSNARAKWGWERHTSPASVGGRTRLRSIIYEMDCDFSHNPKTFHACAEPASMERMLP